MKPPEPRPWPVEICVNGCQVARETMPRTSLAEFLREDLRLTGTHVGCEEGVCGACTVLIDGRSARACLVLAVQADGTRVRTVEGLAGDGPLHPLQRAFRDLHGLQCGFCTPGILMTLVELLEDEPEPTEAQVREALSSHLCRCTGYQNIVAAALRAAAALRGALG
jgi:aerobic-type carbon monoxide dehydrogenase small subunit (CoxS/CutS family)